MINCNRPDFNDTPVAEGRCNYGYAPANADGPAVVSIITPYYNTNSVFIETARSILNQSFQDWEWVIVDDGSTDEMARVQLLKVKNMDPRIKVIEQDNAGPSAARNTAFRYSSGIYLCILDSDDLIEPTFIEKCIWFLESQPSFAFCNTWSVTFGDETFLWTTGFERGSDHIDANSGPPISVIRRTAFEAVGGFNESIRKGHEDWDFWLALAEKGFWGFTIEEYLEWYRRSLKGRFSQIMGEPGANKEFENYIRERYGAIRNRFPDPRMRHQLPYEDIKTSLPFTNHLCKPTMVNRILFLLPWMVTGGADKVNLDWMRGLSANNYQITICTTLKSHNDWLPEFSKITPDIFDLTKFLHPSDYPRFLRYLIESRQIDTVVISGSTIGYQLLPYLRASCPNVAFADLCHVEEPHWLNGGHPRFGVGYQQMFDINIVTTSHLREWMIRRGGDANRIKVCYTGIDIRPLEALSLKRDAFREELGVKDIPLLVFAGRICQQKRPQLLVEILQQLVKNKVNFKAIIIGDGELRPLLSKLVHDHNLQPYVMMLGTVEHRKWLQVLAAADIFLMPSEYEGISVALYESMAMPHVVPVMSDVGGQAEIIDKDCGYLVQRRATELEEYVDNITTLVKNPHLRKAISGNGVAKVKASFTYESTIAQLLDILKEARLNSTQHPRQKINEPFALELATMAIEYKRLSNLADALWAQSGTYEPNLQIPRNLVGVFNLITVISKTNLGKAILQNKIITKMGEWTFNKLQMRQYL